MSTCSLLDSAQAVWDDGLAGVKGHGGVDGEALVADAGDDQTAVHGLHLARGHGHGAVPRTLITHISINTPSRATVSNKPFNPPCLHLMSLFKEQIELMRLS